MEHLREVMTRWQKNQSELSASQAWYKRGKTYRAKTLDALKELYAHSPVTKPGHEPKGIAPKENQLYEQQTELDESNTPQTFKSD